MNFPFFGFFFNLANYGYALLLLLLLADFRLSTSTNMAPAPLQRLYIKIDKKQIPKILYGGKHLKANFSEWNIIFEKILDTDCAQ